MTVRGGGFPTGPLALMPIGRMGPPLRSFAADAHDCIVVWSLDLPNTRLWRDYTALESGLPSDRHPDRTKRRHCARGRSRRGLKSVVRTKPGSGRRNGLSHPTKKRVMEKDALPCLNFLTKKAPYKGLCADSVEKHEPASEADAAVVDSLKALDPNRPIREADSCAAAKRTLAVYLVLLLDNDRLFSASHFAIAKNDPDSFQSHCLRPR